MMKIAFHQIANVLPMMSEAEFGILKNDILRNGLIQPIIKHEGKILSGRNRYNAVCELREELGSEVCDKKGIVLKFEEFKKNGVKGPADLVFALDIARRNLKECQRASIGAALIDHMKRNPLDCLKERRDKVAAGLIQPQEKSSPEVPFKRNKLLSKLSDQLNVGMSSIGKMRTVYLKDRDLFNKVRDGNLTVAKAYFIYKKEHGASTQKYATNKIKSRQEEIAASIPDLIIPSPLCSEVEAIRFSKSMILKGWKLEQKWESNPNKTGELLYYAHFFGNGTIARKNSWEGYIPEPFLARAIVTAAVERLKMPASPVVDMKYLQS